MAKGIDVRATTSELLFRVLLQDSSGVIVATGTTSLRLYELQMADGTLKSYDFGGANINTFQAGALNTETAAMTHRTGNNGATNTGIWTYRLATLTGFTIGNIYFVHVTNTGAFPVVQVREFQFGGAQGDEVSIEAYVAQTGDAYARIGNAGAGLTALGDTRLANLDAAVSSRLATGADGDTGETLSDQLDLAALEATLQNATYGLAALKALLGDVPTNAELATALAGADDAVLAAIAALNNLSSSGAQAAAAAALAAYGVALEATLTAIKAKTDGLPADPADDSDIDVQLAAIAGYIDTEIAAILAAVDTEIAAIKDKTDNLAFTSGNVHAHLKAKDSTLGLSAQEKADAQAEAEDALVAKNLDHLMKTAVVDGDDMTAEVADGTVLSNIMTKEGDTSDFDRLLHSLEKLGDGLSTAEVTVISGVSGSTLNFTIGATYAETPWTGLSIPSNWSKVYFTVKAHKKDEADTKAILQVMKTNPADATNDGLRYLEAASYTTKAHASLAVNQVAGSVGITVADDAMAKFSREYGGLDYDLKVVCSDDTSEVLAEGEVNVSYTPTRAIT